MKFNLNLSIQILERTPLILHNLLHGISKEWLFQNEGPDTWSPFDILGHLIHGEKTDWIPRMDIILSHKEDKSFQPFDRFAQFRDSEGKSLDNLLEEFKSLRLKNLAYLRSKNLSEEDLVLTGQHPELGRAALAQLLASWVVHDLNHISQISRVMASQYKDEVGPWKEYLGILKP